MILLMLECIGLILSFSEGRGVCGVRYDVVIWFVEMFLLLRFMFVVFVIVVFVN